MGKVCALVFSALILAGCSTQHNATTTSQGEGKFDEEAMRLGYPAVFVSQEKPQLDWSKADTEMVGGKSVQVLRGSVVEVCGGCDR